MQLKLLINKPALLASAQMIILANPMEGSQFSYYRGGGGERGREPIWLIFPGNRYFYS